MKRRMTGFTIASLLLLLTALITPVLVQANAPFLVTQGGPDFGSALYRESFDDLLLSE